LFSLKLEVELEHWRNIANQANSTHQSVEEALQQSEYALVTAETQVDNLLHEKEGMSVAIRKLRRNVKRSDRNIKKVASAIQKSFYS
jgi:chromosome segregation ATPase